MGNTKNVLVRFYFSVKTGEAVSAILTSEARKGSKANRKNARTLTDAFHATGKLSYITLPASKGILKGFNAIMKRAVSADDADSVSVVRPLNRTIAEVNGVLANFESLAEGLNQGTVIRAMVSAE